MVFAGQTSLPPPLLLLLPLLLLEDVVLLSTSGPQAMMPEVKSMEPTRMAKLRFCIVTTTRLSDRREMSIEMSADRERSKNPDTRREDRSTRRSSILPRMIFLRFCLTQRT
jgi:hypothetical protein